jgi:hypothetical protein
MTVADSPSQWRIWAAHLALAAMLLRALLPAGSMPSHDVSIPLVICTMDGLETIAPSDPASPAKSVQPDVCPFAAASVLGPAPSVLSLASVAVATGAVLFARREAPQSALRYGPNAPRAPPALS